MAKDKVTRVSTAPLERARELLPTLPNIRFAEDESSAMSDRQLVDAGLGWLAGRLSGDAFTRAEVDATVLRTITDVLGQTLGVEVSGMSVDGQLTLSWESPDKERNEITINLDANV